MTESTARIALRKARYFLSQAQKAESDVSALNDRLPFAANLEAAIVCSRTAIEHLRAEYSSKFNERGYRHWHDQTWRQSSPLFHYFYERRNFILHQQPEATRAQVNVEIHEQIAMAVSVSLTIIQADGTTEHVSAGGSSPPKKAPAPASSKDSTHFFFSDDGWGDQPALMYAKEFIECCEQFVSSAESRFG